MLVLPRTKTEDKEKMHNKVKINENNSNLWSCMCVVLCVCVCVEADKIHHPWDQMYGRGKTSKMGRGSIVDEKN